MKEIQLENNPPLSLDILKGLIIDQETILYVNQSMMLIAEVILEYISTSVFKIKPGEPSGLIIQIDKELNNYKWCLRTRNNLGIMTLYYSKGDNSN